jgi:hypothetical protein
MSVIVILLTSWTILRSATTAPSRSSPTGKVSVEIVLERNMLMVVLTMQRLPVTTK